MSDPQPSAPERPAPASPDAAERRARVRLNLIPEVGAITFGRLLAHFGSAAAALSASPAELAAVEGIGKGRATTIAAGRERVEPDGELAAAAAAGARVVVLGEPDYPAGLRYIHDPPPVLYVRGTLTAADAVAVAVVGSRRASGYGMEQADQLSGGLARCGVTVVSGLARGIDAAAHRAALAAGGRTIAVLGSGLGRLYPAEHRELADRIAASGAVISEFPMDTEPAGGLFPVRNRLISGLSLGVLVVEAPPRSGALITAGLAVEQGREVMAVPGRVDMAGSRGCHELIKQGAKLVESVQDVLDALGEAGRLLREAAALDGPAGAGGAGPAPASLPLDEAEARVAASLDDGPLPAEMIVRGTGLTAATVNATLTRLELKGVVRPEAGGRFARRRR
jgi:DNA processing protein